MPSLTAELRRLTPQGALWHRPRTRRAWRQVGVFPTVADAIGELFQRERRGGDWAALAEGKRPGDDDDE